MIQPRPGQAPRQGPRPLALHLAAAQAAWLSSLAALPMLRNGSAAWKLSEPLQNLVGELANLPSDPLHEAVIREARARLIRLIDSILAYRRHPYRRDLADPPELWSEGSTRLLDYGAVAGEAAGPLTPVLFVPSLINRSYILDLSAKRSFLRWLAARGLRPLLVDWGWPGEIERGFTMSDYVAGRLARALEAALAATGATALPAVGYCMGGALAVGLAHCRPRQVSGLVLLATPWDFHAEYADEIQKMVDFVTPHVPWIERWGEMPVDGLQTLFAALDPLTAARKFEAFSRLDPASDKAEAFVALEDWLNDGIPLVAPVAVECLMGWYARNTPARSEWRIADRPVEANRMTVPSLHLIPSQDRIVPPCSSRALVQAMPGAESLEPPLGHIGMMVGGSAQRQVWEPIAAWLEGVPGR